MTETTRRWTSSAIVAPALVALLVGYSQFGVTAVLGDVAAAFGETSGTEPVQQIGLSATRLGIGLALIRLAGALSLPVAAAADRAGRRTVLLASAVIGIGLTALSGLAAGWWVFVAIVALARPMTTGANTVAGVIGAEETGSADRSKAVALMVATYALGSGLVTVVRAVAPDLGFRAVLGLGGLGIVVAALLSRWIEEPSLYRDRPVRTLAGLSSMDPEGRRRLLILSALTLATSLATGPVYTYLFVYGENVLGRSPGFMAGLILAAGPIGLAGLLAGRWAMDRFGRRITAGITMALTGVTMVVTYSGSVLGLAVGYETTLLLGGAFGPAAAVLAAELFPTSSRATAGGWTVAAGVAGAVTGLASFGFLVDLFGGFLGAALTLGLPVTLASVLYTRLPETRGVDLRDLDELDTGAPGAL